MSASGGAAAGVAAAAAARRIRLQQEEEERMATYGSNDMDGWEFKILRSAGGAFKKRETVEKVRQEEAQAGWEMVEKFDNGRIRFKRRIEHRSKDQHLTIDPYRTSYGIGEGALAGVILGVIFGLVGVGLLLAAMFR